MFPPKFCKEGITFTGKIKYFRFLLGASVGSSESGGTKWSSYRKICRELDTTLHLRHKYWEHINQTLTMRPADKVALQSLFRRENGHYKCLSRKAYPVLTVWLSPWQSGCYCYACLIPSLHTWMWLEQLLQFPLLLTSPARAIKGEVLTSMLWKSRIVWQRQLLPIRHILRRQALRHSEVLLWTGGFAILYIIYGWSTGLSV